MTGYELLPRFIAVPVHAINDDAYSKGIIMTQSPAEKIISQIEGSYEHILGLCRDAAEEALVEPVLPNGWSVKDTIAHLAAWDWRCAELLSVSHDTDAPLKAAPAVNALNDEIYHERHDWSWEEVEGDFRGAKRALIKAIKKLPPERLADAIVQKTIIAETCEHHREHLPALEQWHSRLVASRVVSGR